MKERLFSCKLQKSIQITQPSKNLNLPQDASQKLVLIHLFQAKHTMTFPLPVSLGPSSLRFTGSSISMTFKGHKIYFPEGCTPYIPHNMNKYPLKTNGWKITCPFEMVPVFLGHILNFLVGVPCLVVFWECNVLGSHLQIASVGPCCPCHASLFKVSSPLAKRTIIIWKSQRLPTLPENNIASANGPSSKIHLSTVKATLPKAILFPNNFHFWCLCDWQRVVA